MASIDTILGVVELVAASSGMVDSRIRLQKEAYLLSLEQIGRFRSSSFEYHHYGPYSRELSDAVRYAVIAGMIDEIREEADDGSYVKYSYKLTSEGEKYLSDADSDWLSLRDKVAFLSGKPWRALELAATVRFLQLNDTVGDQDEAFKKAVLLKPATEKYRVEAQQVLDSMIRRDQTSLSV